MGRNKTILERTGSRISELRRSAGMTQAAMAEELEVTVKYVQQMEYGQINIPLLTLSKVADIFGVEISALFVPPTTPKPKPGRPRKR